MNKVLGILSEDEAKDVASIDLDEVMRRFANLHGQGYTADSLRTYKSRTKSSIDDFVRYVERSHGIQSGRSKASATSESYSIELKTRRGIGHFSASPASDRSHPGREQQHQSYRHPDGCSASHSRSAVEDLTPREAKKISNVILAMAMDED